MLKKLSFVDVIEKQELIQKLTDMGYESLVDVFLLRESEVYTKKGRLNKSGACRVLGCKPKELEEKFKEIRGILGPIFDD